jgi:hypothetical protein
MWAFQKFCERHPDLTGDDLSLTKDIANRLTTSDLRYRWLISFGVSTGLWLLVLVVLFALPVIPAGLIGAWLERWVENELAQVWIYLALYTAFIFLCSMVVLRKKAVWNKRKATRRFQIYTAAIDYRSHVLKTP